MRTPLQNFDRDKATQAAEASRTIPCEEKSHQMHTAQRGVTATAAQRESVLIVISIFFLEPV